MCETKIRFLRFPDGRQSLSGPRTHHRCLALFTKQTIIFIACNMVVSRQRRKPLSFPLEKAWKRTVECNKGTAEASWKFWPCLHCWLVATSEAPALIIITNKMRWLNYNLMSFSPPLTRWVYDPGTKYWEYKDEETQQFDSSFSSSFTPSQYNGLDPFYYLNQGLADDHPRAELCSLVYGFTAAFVLQLPWRLSWSGVRLWCRRPRVIPGSGRSTGEEIVYPLQYSWAPLVV